MNLPVAETIGKTLGQPPSSGQWKQEPSPPWINLTSHFRGRPPCAIGQGGRGSCCFVAPLPSVLSRFLFSQISHQTRTPRVEGSLRGRQQGQAPSCLAASSFPLSQPVLLPPWLWPSEYPGGSRCSGMNGAEQIVLGSEGISGQFLLCIWAKSLHFFENGKSNGKN